MMFITNFTHDHIEAAAHLARQNYGEERGFVPALPEITATPDLTGFADNRLGVAAMEGDQLIGYLCAYRPFHHGTMGVQSAWSPLHGNGSIRENRMAIYHRMYQAAAQRWVDAGAVSHGITIYAHNAIAKDALFTYGLGMRCVDTIRPITASELRESRFTFSELPRETTALTTPLRNGLMAHLAQSPCFFPPEVCTEEDTKRCVAHRNSRSFIITDEEEAIGYIELMHDGENFITQVPGMKNICGAYLKPEYRGSGLFAQLLQYMMNILYDEGCTLLGVDFESFNPTAWGFWLKHFDAYTHSVMRRIDGQPVRL